MSSRAPHLQDDRLFECYAAERRGEAIDLVAAGHLLGCPSCHGRYTELGQVLSTITEEAEAEIDARFPPERLRAQQQAIARRLEHVGRAARVITFPGRFVRRHITSSTPRVATRWIAGAAAAGLFVGAAAGMFLPQGARAGRLIAQRGAARPGVSVANAARPAHLAPPASNSGAAPAVQAADDFMSELELAGDRPRTRELLPFDALTPHVREIRDVR